MTNAENKILLLHRNTRHRSQWETPGGKLSGSELAAAAARRCAEEEIGAILTLTHLVGSCLFNSDGLHYTYLWFHATIRCGTINNINRRKHDTWQFFSWNELPTVQDQISGNVEQLYRQYRDGHLVLSVGAPDSLNSDVLDIPLVAGCVIQDELGRILLLHRSRSGRDVWETPGGKVEPGESPDACAAREVREELGIIVAIGPCLGIRSVNHRGKQLLHAWYAATAISGQPNILEDKIHDKWAFRSWSELASAKEQSLSTSVRALLATRREALGGTI